MYQEIFGSAKLMPAIRPYEMCTVIQLPKYCACALQRAFLPLKSVKACPFEEAVACIC